MDANLEARVKIDGELKAAISGRLLRGGVLKNIAENLIKEGIDTDKKRISKILFGELKSVPYDFYSRVTGKEPKEMLNVARARVDSDLTDSLYGRKTSMTFTELAEQLRNKGHNVTRRTISRIRRAGKPRNNYKSVPYELYVELVGKEPNEICWRESNHLARRIAFWYCYFFDVAKIDFAKQIAEDAKQQGLKYADSGMEFLLFYDKRKSNIDPAITDIVAGKFREANNVDYSLEEMKRLVDYLDANYYAEELSDRVDWDVAGPVVDGLIRLTGNPFTAIVGGGITRKRLETGERRLSIARYRKLKKELEELPEYKAEVEYRVKAVQALRRLINAWQNTKVGSLIELKLVNDGKQNYGEKAFMEKILPMYLSIKHEHLFPVPCLEMIVKFPNKMPDDYGTRQEVIASAVCNELLWYKGILDRNKINGFNIAVTTGGISARLSEAMKKINRYSKSPLSRSR